MTSRPSPLVSALLLLTASCQPDQSINRLFSPPVAAITWPAPMAELRQGEGAHPFNGAITDRYDDPPDMTVVWTLDGQDTFEATADAEGAVVLLLEVDGLALGEHHIELSVTDSDGDSDVVGMTWMLAGPISAPAVTILEPAEGTLFAPGTQVTFRGVATDLGAPEDLDLLDFTWSSSLDGVLEGDISADGQSVLFTDALSEGNHTITLTATDIDGETGQDTVQVSVGEVEAPAEPGDLVFSEMMINPQVVQDEVGEWVELYNTASYAIDVAGYSFHDDDLDFHVLEGDLVVAGHDFIVLCADTSTGRNGGVPCDGAFKRESSGELALGNGTDEVILSRPDGVVIDQVFYDSDWFTAGIAIGLDPDEVDADTNDSPDSWCDQTTILTAGGEPGTPGRRNDDCF